TRLAASHSEQLRGNCTEPATPRTSTRPPELYGVPQWSDRMGKGMARRRPGRSGPEEGPGCNHQRVGRAVAEGTWPVTREVPTPRRHRADEPSDKPLTK